MPDDDPRELDDGDIEPSRSATRSSARSSTTRCRSSPRARLPDARDGLKPVQRRILYGMYAQGLRPDRKHQKSAQAVGEVMGKYHPHAGEAIYDALARMAQDFSLRYPLIDGHGNFGSPDPADRPAAQRYTEARLATLAMELLGEIDEETVDFEATYDGQNQEPLGAPRRASRTCSSTAAAASPSAWRRTSRRTTSARSSTPRCTCSTTRTPRSSDLMKIVKGPDFPTGALILGKDGIKDAYTNGPRLHQDARRRGDRRRHEGRGAHRRHRGPVPDVGRGHRRRRSPSS